MKLVTFRDRQSTEASRLGALIDDGRQIIDLSAAHLAMDGTVSAQVSHMMAWLDGGPAARDKVQAVIDWALSEKPPRVTHGVETVVLLAPLPRPRSIRDGMGFKRHVIGCMRAVLRTRAPLLAALDSRLERVFGHGWLQPPHAWQEHPIYYKGNPFSVVGPDTEIRWPSYTSRLDYELEIAAVIGRAGRNIHPERAREHIAGFLIFNDFSARDAQWEEMGARLGPAKGKDFDTGNAMGPCLVTTDELADVYALGMTARVNGDIWSTGNTKDMRWRFEDLIAWVSRDETVHPGEILGSGAVGGGCGWELNRWLKPGDVVELSVDRLGTLRNRISQRSSPV